MTNQVTSSHAVKFPYHQVHVYTVTEWQSIRSRFSTNDEWGFGLLKVWFVGCTSCTLQTLYAWQGRGFVFVWLGSLFIGSYVYHSDVIAGMQLCY